MDNLANMNLSMPIVIGIFIVAIIVLRKVVKLTLKLALLIGLAIAVCSYFGINLVGLAGDYIK